MPLTPTERKLAASLLKMAADEFSNHGCNDYRLRVDGGLTDDEARAVIVRFEAWHQKEDPRGEIEYAPGTEYVTDWLIMRWLAEKLLAE